MRVPPPRHGEVGGHVAAGRRSSLEEGEQPGRDDVGEGPVGDVLVREGVLLHRRAHVTGVHGVRRQSGLRAEGEHEVVERGLGRAVRTPGLVVLHRRVRGDADDDAVATAGARRSARSSGRRARRRWCGTPRRARWGVLRERSHRQGPERAGVEHQEVEAAEVGDDARRGSRDGRRRRRRRACRGRWCPRGCRAAGAASRASVTTIQPASSSARARARPSPEDPPVTRATDGVVSSSHGASVKVQVNLRSRGCHGFTRADVGGRGGQAQRVRRLGTALLRGRGADRGHPHAGRPTPVRAQRAASTGLHPGGVQHRAHPRGGPRGARPAARRAGRRREADWQRISRHWRGRLDDQIAALERLRDGLDSCIGCGCLSLQRCQMSNPGDWMATTDDAPGAANLPALLRRPHQFRSRATGPSPSDPGWRPPRRRRRRPRGRGSDRRARRGASRRRARRPAAGRSGCSGRRCRRR